jgi:hypothetical protein
MRRYLYLICLLLLLDFTARGTAPVKPGKPKLIIRNDSTIVSVRHFDKAALHTYSNQKEFQYREGGYVGESLWSRFWRWFWGLFDSNDKQTALSFFGIIMQYLLIGLGVAALVFLIFKLAGIDVLNVIRRKSMSETIPYDESVENIYAIDFNAEVDKAVSQQNYRLAVRLLYLRSLRQLADAGLIHWDINKTNTIYIDELTNAEQRLAFKLLTRQFEYVWYGEFIIDAQIFTKITALFNNFKVKTA